MSRVTTLPDRVAIDQLAQRGCTDAQIASQVGWKVATVRKWRRRARRGRQGLISSMGRPQAGALSSYPKLMVETLRAWRVAHPGWGPKTLGVELEKDARFQRQRRPHRSSIARFLKEAGLTRSYQRHTDLPECLPPRVTLPHQEWEMDSQGYGYVPHIGAIGLINVADVLSKVKVASYPCLVGHKRARHRLRTEDYQLVLRLAFTEWGLPDRIATDRDSVFYENTSTSPFPTRCHLWLLALGIDVRFGHPGRATERPTVERCHQTFDWQALDGQTFAEWDSLRAYLEQRRHFLNHDLPCRSLADRPPLLAYPQALQPRRLYRPEWEPNLLDLTHIYDYLAQGRWFRKASPTGVVSLGNHLYGLGVAWASEMAEISFDPLDIHFVFRSANGQQTKRFQPQGITPADLMGEMGPLLNLPQFQLALSFSWDDWRLIRLSETLQGTTS